MDSTFVEPENLPEVVFVYNLDWLEVERVFTADSTLIGQSHLHLYLIRRFGIEAMVPPLGHVNRPSDLIVLGLPWLHTNDTEVTVCKAKIKRKPPRSVCNNVQIVEQISLR